MKGDLGSPLVRAYVRGERVKRAHGPSSPLWHRWKEMRTGLSLQMTLAEINQAMMLVGWDRQSNPHGLRVPLDTVKRKGIL